MKRFLALLLALLLVLCALVACGPDDEPDDGLVDGGGGNSDPILPVDGSDPAMPDVEWPFDLPLN